MRKVIHKLFWAWDFDKEEKWLNEMAAKGLALVSVGWLRYEFEPCLPGEYSIRLEFLENRVNHPESEQYTSFIEDMGAEQVGSMMRWVYFRKKSSEGEFELFSDKESKIKYLNRILLWLWILGGVNLYCVAYNMWLFFYFGSYINLVCVLNLVLCILMAGGILRLNRKKKLLKKEQSIFE